MSWRRNLSVLISCMLNAVLKTCVQVDVRLGPASETLDRLAAEGCRFDLAFLDADKTGYLGYYEKVLSKSRRVTCCSTLPPIQSDVSYLLQVGNSSCAVQLMKYNLIVPGGAIIVDNSLMKVSSFICLWRWGLQSSA